MITLRDGPAVAPLPAEPSRPKAPMRRRRSLWGEFWRWLVTAFWFLFFALLISGAILLVSIYRQARTEGARPAQAIVVLGTAQYNGWPGPVFQSRLDHALRLYWDGYAPYIVVTGGKQPGDGFTEAEAAQAYLMNAGVPASNIIMETEASNTWESMQNVSAILEPQGITDVILVSDGFHLYRSRMMANDVGLRSTGSPAPDSPIVVGGSGEFAYTLREAGGVLAHLWTTRIDPDGRILKIEAN
jgi:uncharacterized SAM-binding protein YcdF (DUF218 family)